MSAEAADAAEVRDAPPDADQANDAASSTADALASASAPTTVLVSATSAGPGRTHTSPSMVAGGVGHDVIVAFDDTDEDLTDHVVGWARSADDGATFTDEGHFPDSPAGGVTDNDGFPLRRARRDHRRRLRRGPRVGAGGAERDRLLCLAQRRRHLQPCPERRRSEPRPRPTTSTFRPSPSTTHRATRRAIVYVAYADFVDGGTSSVKLRLSTYTNHAFAVTEVVSPPLDSGGEASLPSVAVAPDHTVSIAYYAQASGSGGPSIAIVQSSDQGQHFDVPVAVAPLHMPIARRLVQRQSGTRRDRPRRWGGDVRRLLVPPAGRQPGLRRSLHRVRRRDAGRQVEHLLHAVDGPGRVVVGAGTGQRRRHHQRPVPAGPRRHPRRHPPRHRLLRPARRRRQPERKPLRGHGRHLGIDRDVRAELPHLLPALPCPRGDRPLPVADVLFDPHVDDGGRQLLLRRVRRLARRPPRRSPGSLRRPLLK